MSGKEKIYCGSGKQRHDYPVCMNICLSDIPKEYISKSENTGKSYVRLLCVEKKQIDQYGNTHYITVDTWKPDPDYKKPAQNTPPPQNKNVQEELPF